MIWCGMRDDKGGLYTPKLSGPGFSSWWELCCPEESSKESSYSCCNEDDPFPSFFVIIRAYRGHLNNIKKKWDEEASLYNAERWRCDVFFVLFIPSKSASKKKTMGGLIIAWNLNVIKIYLNWFFFLMVSYYSATINIASHHALLLYIDRFPLF